MTTTIKTTMSKKDHLILVDNDSEKASHLRAWGLSHLSDLDEYVNENGMEEEFEFEYIIRHNEDECPFCILKDLKKEARD
jgi:hypothetical protein